MTQHQRYTTSSAVWRYFLCQDVAAGWKKNNPENMFRVFSFLTAAPWPNFRLHHWAAVPFTISINHTALTYCKSPLSDRTGKTVSPRNFNTETIFFFFCKRASILNQKRLMQNLYLTYTPLDQTCVRINCYRANKTSVWCNSNTVYSEWMLRLGRMMMGTWLD